MNSANPSPHCNRHSEIKMETDTISVMLLLIAADSTAAAVVSYTVTTPYCSLDRIGSV